MNTIYSPDGRALEYCELALNIYTGCPHGCTYCYAAKNAKRWGKPFAENVRPREGLLEQLERKLRSQQITGQTIHLCFNCDPYPVGVDTTVTREVIKILKGSGNHVQILTKGGKLAERDFDLLDGDDRFGVTITGADEDVEPNAAPFGERLCTIETAKRKGIKTWVSCEPVLHPGMIYLLIGGQWGQYIDRFAIGKLNYEKSDIKWGAFGQECERLCNEYGREYYIKADLRDLMQEADDNAV